LKETLESVHRDLQFSNARWWPALGGLGLHKPLHRVPGLGHIWKQAGNSLSKAESIIVVGFSMSPFDTMARLQMAAIRLYGKPGTAKRVIVVDPMEEVVERYRQLFGGDVEAPLIGSCDLGHQDLDWTQLLASSAYSNSANAT